MLYTLTRDQPEADDRVVVTSLEPLAAAKSRTTISPFTTEGAAQLAAQESAGESVQGIAPAAVVQLLAECVSERVTHLSINPSADGSDASEKLIAVGDVVRRVADSALVVLKEPVVLDQRFPDHVGIVNCQYCGDVIHVELGSTLPACCGREMTLAAKNYRKGVYRVPR
ncbi:MAG: hypothetical protein ACRCT8_04110 [Lacipirellulaceae bacterium]